LSDEKKISIKTEKSEILVDGVVIAAGVYSTNSLKNLEQMFLYSQKEVII